MLIVKFEKIGIQLNKELLSIVYLYYLECLEELLDFYILYFLFKH